MDDTKLIELLRATLDPNQREAAEKQLKELHQLVGFTSSLLRVVMMNNLEMPVRQAGAIYLKNQIIVDYQSDLGKTSQEKIFHEEDRTILRNSIVDAVVHAPDLIKVQLAVCVYFMIQHEFPVCWSSIVEKISFYLQSNETSTWNGALLCLYKLVKNYEYKKVDERGPLNEAMVLFLPMLYQRSVQLLPDQSEKAVELQKMILKIFYSLVQYIFPIDLITQEVFRQWMEIFRTLVLAPIPEHTNQIDEDERPNLIWWKCKKWVHHILSRVFERYGSPGNVNPEYQEFAVFYLKTFSNGILEAILKTLFRYTQKEYVSPRVLHQCLYYLNHAVNHAISWKYLKPNMMGIIQNVVFPVMSYTDQDDELWNNDPHEYIRMKFDAFEDYVSPVSAAQKLIHFVCKMRKGMLTKILTFVMSILNNPNCTPREKDGALHIVGTVANILLSKKMYKDQMENMLVTYVYPEFQSPYGFMRARACWTLHYFCEIQFKNETNLYQAITLTQQCLLNDKDLPVKVEAAIALQNLISSQDKAEAFIKPNIRPIALELLKIIRETENEDLTGVMQKIICSYSDQLMPIAVEMIGHLAQTYKQVVEGGEDNVEDKAITAMGVLNTINTVLCVMEDQKDIKAQLEPIVLDIVLMIFNDAIIEFYEEALALMETLTSSHISPALWQAFEILYKAFQVDALDFFTDMMPVLHNYITVDTPTFVSNENHLLAIYNMCKTVFTSQIGEDAECHAAKLLEVVILQCRVDKCIPSFVELALNRLTRSVATSELRTMCLQVVVAALYVNPQLLLETLDHFKLPNSTESFTNLFIQQWLNDIKCFLGVHDRKLSVLGLCTLIGLNAARPAVLANYAQQILPALLTLFEGLEHAYAYRAQEEEEDSEDECDDGEYEDQGASDDDDIDEEDPNYLEHIANKIKAHSPFPVTSSTIHDCEHDSDLDDEGLEETALESFTTPLDSDDCPIDEYVFFKQVLQTLQGTDPNWYNAITAHLSAEQQKALQDVIVLSDQRKAAAESKQIEKSGGYVFLNQTVPSSFNFGGTPFS